MRTHVTFDEVRKRREIKIRCRSCHKILRRVVSEYSTINPFNRNPDGTVCSPKEVHEQVRLKLAEAVRKLEAAGVECRSCEFRKADLEELGA